MYTSLNDFLGVMHRQNYFVYLLLRLFYYGRFLNDIYY